ncbi:large conductance mechanosensitive channel protein [Bacteriovorax sp. BSW11_IV]|uniref:large-conductance mechanosensitive channel protein MscL n=1 Tax=Bacteriovorax sp. BSW11_IV TaxID=1353529 RepID=UPI00038A01DD|nr:large conductance mechanosensitive channel protein [Bacteriovorax sp. BSW11_IV]
MMGFIKEFKTFAMRGNVLDLAVGMIIGAAFTGIVKSLVDHILSPILGLIIGGIKLDSLTLKLATKEDGQALLTLNYGQFLQASINFILMAFAIFCLIKFVKSFEKKEEVAPIAEPAPSKEEILLAEIRDLLKK